jgi:hypothetical protein
MPHFLIVTENRSSSIPSEGKCARSLPLDFAPPLGAPGLDFETGKVRTQSDFFIWSSNLVRPSRQNKVLGAARLVEIARHDNGAVVGSWLAVD